MWDMINNDQSSGPSSEREAVNGTPNWLSELSHLHSVTSGVFGGWT